MFSKVFGFGKIMLGSRVMAYIYVFAHLKDCCELYLESVGNDVFSRQRQDIYSTRQKLVNTLLPHPVPLASVQ